MAADAIDGLRHRRRAPTQKKVADTIEGRGRH
jgi:hypothetical protein